MNQTRAGSNIAWESLALSEMASAYLARSPHWLISHPDWIMTGANRDSLAFTDYCLDFSRRIGLDYVVLGRFDKGKSGYEVAFSLFQLTRRTPLYDGRTASAGIREIGEDVGSAIHKAITGRQLSQIDPLWSSERQLQYYSESKLFFLKNDLQAAYEKARNALKLDSTSTICLNYLAEIEVQSARQQMTDGEVPIARFSRANSLLRASADIDKDNPNTYLHFAQLYVLNKRWGLAEESLKHSLDLNPLNSKLYTLLAQLHPDRYKDLGFSSDREVLARALFINPCDFDARLTLADIYRTVNKPDRAVAILKEGLRINPNKISVLMALA
ncbi:MAG: tetratricopeptide repeat protein, partial [bacterium]